MVSVRLYILTLHWVYKKEAKDSWISWCVWIWVRKLSNWGRFLSGFFFCCQPWPMKETTFYTKEENYIEISENPHKIYCEVFVQFSIIKHPLMLKEWAAVVRSFYSPLWSVHSFISSPLNVVADIIFDTVTQRQSVYVLMQLVLWEHASAWSSFLICHGIQIHEVAHRYAVVTQNSTLAAVWSFTR